MLRHVLTSFVFLSCLANAYENECEVESLSLLQTSLEVEHLDETSDKDRKEHPDSLKMVGKPKVRPVMTMGAFNRAPQLLAQRTHHVTELEEAFEKFKKEPAEFDLENFAKNHPEIIKMAGKPKARAVMKMGPFDQGQQLAQAGAFDTNPKPAWTGWAMFVCWCVYIAACAGYELRQMRAAESAKPNEDVDSGVKRNDEWDLIKFFCVYIVVALHTGGLLIDVKRTFQYMWVGSTWTIPGLIMVSGVFSASVHHKAMLVTIVGFPCTLLMFDLLLFVVTAITPGAPVFQIGRSGVEWYLQCMIVWRLVCAPLFHFARQAGIPRVVPLSAVWLVSYLLWFGIELQEVPKVQVEISFPEHEWLSFLKIEKWVGGAEVMRALAPVFPWRPLVAWMPIFSFGLLFSPQEWGRILFEDRRVIGMAYAAFVLYHGAMVFSTDFHNWYDVACYNVWQQCVTSWWPRSILKSGINLETFAIFMRVSLQRIPTLLMWLVVIGSWTTPLKRYMPRVATFFIGCGTRTLYPYLLHWVLWCIPGLRTTFGWHLAQFLHPIKSPYFYLVGFPICFVVYLALSCQLTELLFGFIVKTPIWAIEYFGKSVDSAKKEDGKSKDTRLPQ